jgi:Uma2 family endonuclease
MAFVLGDRPVRPLSVDDVLRMLRAGILTEDNRLELLHGLLTEKAVKSPEHCEIKNRLADWLWRPDRHRVRVEGALLVADQTSLPEPDIAVVERVSYGDRHPAGALLVIEVARTSLTVDLQVKPPLYAATGVPDYWVVDIDAHRVHVFRTPTPGDGYATRTTHGATDTLAPLSVDVPPLPLNALFEDFR